MTFRIAALRAGQAAPRMVHAAANYTFTHSHMPRRLCGTSSSTLLTAPATTLVTSEEDRKLIPPVCGAPACVTPPHGENQQAPDASTVPAEEQRVTSYCPSPQGEGYAPWEIKALILPLVPVGTAVQIRDIILLLPRAARNEMQREGTPLDYVRKHLSDCLTVKGTHICRHSLVDADATARQGSAAAPPPPPPPPPVGGSHGGGANGARDGNGGRPGGVMRTPLEVLDKLVEFIPTFFVQHQTVAEQLPTEITKQYADSSFLFYLRRFRHYIDIRANHGTTEIRLRPDFSHPKRGAADILYTTGMSGNDMLSQLARGRRPPRNSEANLIHFVVPRMPTVFTPIATVLQDVSDIVSRHPSFDPRLGVTGLFEKYPEYFQIVDAKLRVRPFRSAPNSLDDLDASTSPLPAIYAKIKKLVDAQAEGKDYSNEAEKAQAVVPTGKLYALLTEEEKKEVKAKCRSFPRFLRLHGQEIVLSVDSMKVYQFRPTYERCAETLMDQRLMASSLSPDDPVLKIPAVMDDSTSADWAVRELYDALPLMQCAELDEVMSLVPPSVKKALPHERDKLVEHLGLYPDYFATWSYPDDPSVTVVQRAKLETLPLERDDIVRMVLPLVPQGGIEATRLMRRVPLPLQRHFYRHGLRKVLGELNEYFLVVGDRVLRVG